MVDLPIRPANILLVEDNHADVVLTKHTFASMRVNNTISVATDGDIALKRLLQEGEYAGEPLPDLIFLDLNLPKIEGRDVLKRIKSEEHLKNIPVVIMSGSKAQKDQEEVYELEASAYILKPLNLEKLVEVAKSIDHFHLSLTLSAQE